MMRYLKKALKIFGFVLLFIVLFFSSQKFLGQYSITVDIENYPLESIYDENGNLDPDKIKYCPAVVAGPSYFGFPLTEETGDDEEKGCYYNSESKRAGIYTGIINLLIFTSLYSLIIYKYYARKK